MPLFNSKRVAYPRMSLFESIYSEKYCRQYVNLQIWTQPSEAIHVCLKQKQHCTLQEILNVCMIENLSLLIADRDHLHRIKSL